MKIIFCESTLSKKELELEYPGEWVVYPAVRRGDIYSIINREEAIECLAIVDGLFDQCLSVSHKEILLALKKGISVIGLSSMGALRASELYNYGMLGSGEVFKRYKDQLIDSDEEVAISYTQRKGKMYSTVPLINIRLSVEKHELGNSIIQTSRKIFFKERTWDRVQQELTKKQFVFLKNSYVDQKKKDLLNFLSSRLFDFKTIVREKSNIYTSFFLDDFIFHKYGGYLNYIKLFITKISCSKEIERKQSNISIYITQFFDNDIPEENVLYLLGTIDKIQINIDKLKNFGKATLRELSLSSEESLRKHLNNRNIPIEYYPKIVGTLYLFYKTAIYKRFGIAGQDHECSIISRSLN